MTVDDALLYAAFDIGPERLLDFVVRHAGPEPRRILDAGCGVGRMLRALADRGWDVSGIEPNASFAAAARRAAPGVPVRVAGIEEIEEVDTFDVVLVANDPLQYVLTAAGRLEALRRIHRALRPADASSSIWPTSTGSSRTVVRRALSMPSSAERASPAVPVTGTTRPRASGPTRASTRSPMRTDGSSRRRRSTA